MTHAPQLFPLGAALGTEVFGIDRTDDGVPPFDFRVCAERPGEPAEREVGGGIVLFLVFRDDLLAFFGGRPQPVGEGLVQPRAPRLAQRVVDVEDEDPQAHADLA